MSPKRKMKNAEQSADQAAADQTTTADQTATADQAADRPDEHTIIEGPVSVLKQDRA